MDTSDLSSPAPFSGLRLRQLREERGLSRQELARATEPPLSRAYIYLLEGSPEEPGDAARRPSYDVVLRLAKALDVSSEAFSAAPVTQADANRSSDSVVPPALRDAAIRFNISERDVDELQRFSFRGRRPQSASDWARLWMAILSSIGLELP
jgi:transcriptional regulator with XRE-family HTH domain